MSDNLIIDLTHFRDRQGANVPPDRYKVQVEDVEVTNSRAGNKMINLFLRISGGDYDGSTLVDRLVLTEKSLFRVVAFMQAVGFKTPNKRLQVNPQRFIGKSLYVDVEDGEPYNGTVRSEVRGYSRVVGAAAASDDVTDLDDSGPVEGSEGEQESAADSPVDDSVSNDVGDLDEVDLEEVDV